LGNKTPVKKLINRSEKTLKSKIMDEQIQKELQELTNLETAGGIDDIQQSRLTVLKMLDEAEKTAIQKSKDLESALAQKEHFRTKSEELEKKHAEEIVKIKKDTSKATLDVGDYIDISASLEGLDQKEKEKLAYEHKITGKPLSELRKDEDYILWQGAHREKVDKEKALAPNTNQGEVTKPKTMDEEFASAKTQEDKEKVLNKYGLNPLNPRKDYHTL
jgi:hypothetical protein